MMKMVPASRRVTEASWEPPSSARRRATTPAGEAVADCVSITATRVHPETRREAAAIPGSINHSLRLGWAGGASQQSFRGDAQHRTSDAQLRIGESRDSQ